VELRRDRRVALGPWLLFLVFLFGPCEPLIPLVIVPAAQHSWGVLLSVSAVFGVVTISSMTAVVAGEYLGVARLAGPGQGRWSHALAGAALTACGVAVRMGL
jgi:threonine/homoserine/homoserine lactone efflux protein